MAIVITGKSTCALCGETLLPKQEIVGTPHFIADRKDPLWRFSDAAMHRTCFDEWEHRAEFVARYEQVLEELRHLTEQSRTGTLVESEQLLQQLRRS
jgi:hypothetical protein